MEIGTEISQKIRSAIKAKLIELGAYVDDELPDYIMVMVANKRSQKQMTDDLSLFLSTNTEKFTTWLHGLLKKLQSINTDQVQNKPKHKEKHKTEKKKHRVSGASEKSGKTDTEKTSTDGKKDGSKKQKVEERENEGKMTDRITSTVKTGEEEPATEISISENTDEFNEENKAVEKAESSIAGKQTPGKKSERSGEGKKMAAKSPSQGKSEKESKKVSKKKPSSFVASVKRKYELEEEEEEYDPLNPAVGNVASVIRGPTRKSSIPKSMQANRSLLMKAVTDAEKSISTIKKLDISLTDSSAGMKSDQRPVDVRKRLKTAAGLQLISRSTKRKGLEDMTYTIENDVKKPKKSTEELANLKYTVKNVQIIKPSDQKRSKGPAVAPVRVAASALKGITENIEIAKQQEIDANDDNDDDDGRASTDSDLNSDESDLSGDMDLSAESEIGEESGMESEEGLEEGSDMETDEESNEGSGLESEGEYSVEEVEIEVTDRASQTAINMREANFKSAGLMSESCDKDSQTDTTEFSGLDMKLSKEKLRDTDSCLFNLFIDNLLPFEFVENDSFKLFAKTLQPKYHFPKRKKLIAEIGMIYNTVKDDLKYDLSRSESYVITQNTWKNLTGKLYNSISVQFITTDWVLKKAVIKTSLVDENNLVENMAHMLEETKLKWHLSTPTALLIATDSEKSVSDLLEWQKVFCFGRCVQDIVKDCLEIVSISDFIQRGRDLIKAVCDNQQVADMFEKKKQVLLSSQSHTGKLELDGNGSDWSKTLDMIIRLTEQTPALHAAIMDTDLTNQGVDLRSQLYNFNEQSVLESLVKILSPFKTATDILTNTDGLPSLQKVIPTLIKLEKVVERESNDSSEIEDVKLLIKSKIHQILKVNRDVYLLSCLLHPQTKQIGFLSQEDRDAARTLLLKEVKSLCEEEFGQESRQEKGAAKFRKGKKQLQKQTAAMSEKVDNQDTRCIVILPGEGMNEDKSEDKISSYQQSEESENEKKVSDNVTDGDKTKIQQREIVSSEKSSGDLEHFSMTVENDWLDDVIRAPEERKSPEEVAKIELDVYMAEPAGNKHPLSWWKEKCPLYPRICRVAKKILGIPASSLTSEDVYKLTSSLPVLDIRVKPEHVDMMMFLNRNKHLLV